MASHVQRPELVVTPLVVDRDFVADVKTAVRYIKLRMAGPATVKTIQEIENPREVGGAHSSVSNGFHSTLSKAGECCVAQFYRNDYMVLRELEFACRGSAKPSCLSGLRSIVTRRQEHVGELVGVGMEAAWEGPPPDCKKLLT